MIEHYFKMEVNVIESDRVERLMEETGNEGFGIYMLLLCVLRRKENYRCDTTLLKSIARKYMMKEEVLEKVVQNYGLFCTETEGENTFISSPHLWKVMAGPDKKRTALSTGGKTRAGTAKRAANGQFTSSDQLVEKRIEENSKKEEKEKEEKAVAVTTEKKHDCNRYIPRSEPRQR